MGGNGSKNSGSTTTDAGRRWKTVVILKNGAKVIEFKDRKTPGKMPEESHSPNAIYVMINKNGNGVKAIAIYDNDCKKIAEIHPADHKGIGPHYHEWKDGEPIGEPIAIDTNPTYSNILTSTENSL